MNNIKMGQKVRDKVTRFEGFVVAKIDYITGCNQCGIVPEVEAGQKYPDTTYIDCNRLEIIDGSVSINSEEPPGGYMVDAPK